MILRPRARIALKSAVVDAFLDAFIVALSYLATQSDWTRTVMLSAILLGVKEFYRRYRGEGQNG